jgi:hypothetical protein
MVHRAGEHALPRALDDTFAERRPKAICCPAYVSLDAGNLRSCQTIELRDLHNPDAANLH